MDEFYNKYAPTIPEKLLNPYVNSTDGLTFEKIMKHHGGGITIKNDNTMESIVYTKSKDYNRVVPLHEFFGHGRPVSIETVNDKHDLDDAIRFENLVWRLLGEPNNQRDGHDHGGRKNVPITNPQDLPTFR